MSLRCRPNDLAIVIRAPHVVQHHIGKIVELSDRLGTSFDGQPCWYLKHPFADVVQGRRGTCHAIADRDLQPIRGSDAPAVEVTTRDIEIAHG